MLTGGTGYIGSWLAKYLLESAYTVRLCVRDKANTSKYHFLEKVAETSPGKLELHEANLLVPGSYDDIAKGCTLIFHIASPFTLKVKNPQKELVDPAVNGTRNVLNAANKSDSVKRVILTSSVVAIYGDNRDMTDQGLSELNEDHWNTTSSLTNQPYAFSKVLAEKEAWKINKEQKQWDLVVINPSFVMGPSLAHNSDSASLGFMKDILVGKFAMGAPDLHFCFVDVRDVAKAHILAAEKPSANGRHILSEGSKNIMEMTKVIEETFPGKYRLPKMKSPKILMYLVGPLFGVNAKFVSKNIGYPIYLNANRSKEELGIEYTPFKDTIKDMIVQMAS